MALRRRAGYRSSWNIQTVPFYGKRFVRLMRSVVLLVACSRWANKYSVRYNRKIREKY